MKVMFVDKTRPYYSRKQKVLWGLVTILIIIELGIIAVAPDWAIVPPNWKPPTNVEYIK